MICTWNKQSLFTNLQCFLPHSEMSQIWPDKLHIAWWCSSAETQKSLIDCWAVLNYHVQAATNQDASQILVELHHLDHLEPLGKIACPGFGNNETLKEKWIILFGPQCVKLDLEVYNVCKLLCNSGSLLCTLNRQTSNQNRKSLGITQEEIKNTMQCEVGTIIYINCNKCAIFGL